MKTLKSNLSAASDVLRRVQQGVETRGKRKGDSEYTERHARRLKKQRVSASLASLSWLDKEGLKPLKLEVYNSKTNKSETIELNSIEEALQLNDEHLDKESLDRISMMLYVKDRFNVSGCAYRDMAKVCHEMPRYYTPQNRINELNKLWDIKPTPNGVVGVQQSLQDRLHRRITHLLTKSSADAPFRVNKKVWVKLSGDGTTIGKRLHVINFTFTLLNKGEQAYSAEGNHSLAIFREPETYESLQHALEDIITEVDSLDSIEVGGTEFEIEYLGDWKFLALVTGKYTDVFLA